MSGSKIVFLIYNGVEVLDFTGPFDVFSMANLTAKKPAFELKTVSPDGRMIKTLHGISITPDYSFKDYPKSQTTLLVIPGGIPSKVINFKYDYPDVIRWIRDMKSETEIIASVCVGALIGAQVGLFDKLDATTHHNYFEALMNLAGGEVNVRAGCRYVDNKEESPRIVSSGGVSAGIDMAFYLLGELVDQETMIETARIMEYNATSNWAL